MVSEVIFRRFWGVGCIEKCFRNFEIVVGSAVSEISRFGPFGVWRTVLINYFNRVGSTFRQTWSCKNL